MANDDDDKDGIFRVQTVPPPPGTTDAYNAPTKVGPMAAAIVGEMVEYARRRAAGEDVSPPSTTARYVQEPQTAPRPTGPASRPRPLVSSAEASSPVPTSGPRTISQDEPLPTITEDIQEDSDEGSQGESFDESDHDGAEVMLQAIPISPGSHFVSAQPTPPIPLPNVPPAPVSKRRFSVLLAVIALALVALYFLVGRRLGI